MDKEKKQKVEVTEMFFAKACPNRVFWGIITRSQDDHGNPIVFSRILMDDDGLLCAQASDQKVQAKNLNSLARMNCFEGLHDDGGKSQEIFGSDFIKLGASTCETQNLRYDDLIFYVVSIRFTQRYVLLLT